MEKVLNFIYENWEWLAVVIYELFVRLKMTAKNLSILDNVLKVIGFLIPNRRKPDGTEETIKRPGEPAKNKILVDLFRHVIKGVLVVCLLSSSAEAQLYDINRAEAFANADSVAVKAWLESLKLKPEYGPNIGAIYYNRQSTKFRVYYDSAWHDLIQGGGGGGGGSLVGAKNGLRVENDSVKMGAPLTENTIIDLNNKDFTFGDGVNPGNFYVNTNAGNIELNNGQGDAITMVVSGITMNSGGAISGNAPEFNFSNPGISGISFTTSATDISRENGTPINLSVVGGVTPNISNGVGVAGVTSSTNLTPSIFDINGVPIELGNLSADPGVGQNGRMYYNTTTNTFRCYQNGAWTDCIPLTITNTAFFNEIPKTDSGTGNLIPSGVFNYADGNITLGANASTGTVRTINADGSGANIGINLQTKGSTTFNLNNGTANYLTVNAADGTTTIGSSSLAGNRVIQGLSSTASARLDVVAPTAGTVRINNRIDFGQGIPQINAVSGGDLALESASGTVEIAGITANNSGQIQRQGGGAVFFVPAATIEGINVGTLAGNPSGATNGGLWVNSSNANKIQMRSGSATVEVAGVLSGAATLDFPSTPAQSSSDLTITVTGTIDGDNVSVGVPNGSMTANATFFAWVSAANTVSVRYNNYSAAAQDPASGTFRVAVIKN